MANAGPDAGFLGIADCDDFDETHISNSCGTTVWLVVAADLSDNREHVIYIPEVPCAHVVAHALAESVEPNRPRSGIHIYADAFTENHLADAARAVADGACLRLGQTSMLLTATGPYLKVRRVPVPAGGA